MKNIRRCCGEFVYLMFFIGRELVSIIVIGFDFMEVIGVFIFCRVVVDVYCWDMMRKLKIGLVELEYFMWLFRVCLWFFWEMVKWNKSWEKCYEF